MRLFTLLLATLALLDLTQCGTPPRINWPQLAQCSTAGAPADLLDSVTQVLLGNETDPSSSTIGDRAVAALEALAEKHGAQLVECLVDEATRALDGAVRQSVMAARMKTGAVSTQTLAADRGRDFLQRVAKARVERDAP